MEKILIVGANQLAKYYIDIIQAYSDMKIIAIICEQHQHEYLPAFIPAENDISHFYNKEIDYILHCDESIQLRTEHFAADPLIIDIQLLDFLKPFTNSFKQQFNNLELILNNIKDGLIVIDAHANVQFMNKTAKNILKYRE